LKRKHIEFKMDYYSNHSNISVNITDNTFNSEDEKIESQKRFELIISIIVSISFSFTIVVGFIGNSLVIMTILMQQKMRNTTNILILNLAIADLCLIIFCIPYTGLNYVLSVYLIIFFLFFSIFF
jgi:allatostatin A receptor